MAQSDYFQKVVFDFLIFGCRIHVFGWSVVKPGQKPTDRARNLAEALGVPRALVGIPNDPGSYSGFDPEFARGLILIGPSNMAPPP